MWRIHANNTIKCEELLEANLQAMYELVLSICDPVLQDQVCNHKDYEEIDNKQDMLGLLRCIKMIMYSNGDDDTHMRYNHVIAITHYYHTQQTSPYRIIMTSLWPTGRYASNWVSRLVRQRIVEATC